jgi:hypothetical protein
MLTPIVLLQDFHLRVALSIHTNVQMEQMVHKDIDGMDVLVNHVKTLCLKELKKQLVVLLVLGNQLLKHVRVPLQFQLHPRQYRLMFRLTR